MPVTNLLDMVSNRAVWPNEMRLQAARILPQSTSGLTGNSELARKVALTGKSEGEFSTLMAEG